jgi:hypothetical protein
MSKVKLSMKIGTMLKATKPKSVKSLQKFLIRDLRDYDFEARGPYKCGVSSQWPKEVVAWCMDWLNVSGLDASFTGAEHGGYDISVTKKK